MDLVLKQKSELKKILSSSTTAQRQLLLERYASLLMSSPYVKSMNPDEKELRDFVFLNFFVDGQDQESPQKKNKRAQVYSKEIEQGLADLARSFHGRFHGELLELSFICGDKQYELPFEIVEVTKEHDYELKLSGVQIPQFRGYTDDNPRCLQIYMPHKTTTATLNWVGTQETACPIPEVRGGECLLGIAEQIAKAVGKKKMMLIDASDIKCSVNLQSASLRRLKIYQEGQGWYEKYNYKPTGNSMDYKTRLYEFRYYLMSQLLDNLSKFPHQKNYARGRGILEAQALEFNRLNIGRTVSEFMTWLWKKDCSLYIEVDKLLSNDFYSLDISKRYPKESVFRKDL